MFKPSLFSTIYLYSHKRQKYQAQYPKKEKGYIKKELAGYNNANMVDAAAPACFTDYYYKNLQCAFCLTKGYLLNG